jgi:hypothetical protein
MPAHFKFSTLRLVEWIVQKKLRRFVVNRLSTKTAKSFAHFAFFARQFYQTSTGPFGTGICSRRVEAGSASRMKDATIGRRV